MLLIGMGLSSRGRGWRSHGLEEFAMGLEREKKAEGIRDDQEDRESETEGGEDRRIVDGPCCGEGGREEKSDGGEKEESGLEPGGRAIEFLGMIAKASQKERGSEHEERVCDDRSRERGFDESVFTGPKGGEGNDKFGEIPQGGVEKSANENAGGGGDRVRGVGE